MRTALVSLALSCAVVSLTAPLPARAAWPGPPSTPSDTVPLPGSVPAAVARATRDGAGAPGTPITLTVVLRRADQAGFDAFLRDVRDPASPEYGRFLSQADLARRFGPAIETYDAVRAWLEDEGLAVVAPSVNRLTLTVRGTRAQAERAFGVRLDDYRLGDRTFHANAAEATVPRALAPHVHSVTGLSNLARPVRAGAATAKSFLDELPQPPDLPDDVKTQAERGLLAWSCWLAVQLSNQDVVSIPGGLKDAFLDPLKDKLLKSLGVNYSLHQVSPAVTYLRYRCAADQLNMLIGLSANPTPAPLAPSRAVRPAAARVAAASAPGTGQTIGLLQFDSFEPSDVRDFLNLIGLGSRFSQLSRVPVAGGAGAPGPNASEVLLDVDAVMSLAPGARVVVYEGPFTGRGSFQTMFNAMIGDGVDIISNSWAYCEDQTTLADVESIDSVLASAAAAGITVLSASGDLGSTCLDGSPNTVHVPASSPHVTAVGGTTPARNVAGTYGSERWWDGSTDLVPGGQSGFGVSRFFPRPPYQNAVSSAPMRSVPDVTAPADPRFGYVICQAAAGGCPTGLLYGGTSVAAPIWAAFVAALNQAGGRRLGFLNPLLYPLANTPAFHSAAEMGTDFAHVGLGSPNVGRLHRALTNAAPGPVDTAGAIVGAFPPLVVANGTSVAGVVVLLRDAAGHTLDGVPVSLAANAGSTAVITPINAVTNVSNGAALFLVKNTVAETVTLTATVGGAALPRTARVMFVTPPAAFGAIAATPGPIAADGSSAATITVTLEDEQHRPAAGKLVAIGQGNGGSIVSSTTGLTDAAGRAQFTARSFVSDTITYTAVDATDGLAVPGGATVTFANAGARPCNIGPGAAAAGYAVSTFASGFASDFCVGPLGLAFDARGDLYVGNASTGALHRFGAGGGAAGPATLVHASVFQGAGRLTGIAFGKDGRLYAAQEHNPGRVVELDPDTGAIRRTIATFDGALGLAVDPVSGDVFVSNFDGVARISAFAAGPGTVTPYFAAGFTDGLAFGPDGTLYVKAGCCPAFIAAVAGTAAPTPGASTIIAFVPEGDGLGIEPNPANPGKPFVYVNRTDGKITRVDTSASPAALLEVFTDGSRGDFVTVGPDGCLYATQTERVVKLTRTDGSCGLAPTNPAPRLVLAPVSVAPAPAIGTRATFTARLANAATVAGVPVTLLINGPNYGLTLATTDATGTATFSHPGVLPGVDQVVAYATVPEGALTSNAASVTWGPGRHTTYLGLSQLPGSGAPGTPVSLAATLVDLSVRPIAPVSGVGVRLGIGAESCTATTDAKGTASCAVTPAGTSGSSALAATFDGTTSHLGSADARVFTLVERTPGPVGGVVGATVWLGLLNSDDQGTQFDVEVRLYRSLADPVGQDVARGLARCVTGLTRNPSLARMVRVAFPEAVADVGAVRVFARVGTNLDGTRCPGPGGSHLNARGLRVYLDAASRASRLDGDGSPVAYLHTRAGRSFLDTSAPTGATPAQQDALDVNITRKCAADGSRGLCPTGANAWKEVGAGWAR